MRVTLKVFIFIILSLIGFLKNMQSQSNSDSINVCTTVNNFFNWYITSIKNNKTSEYQPQFIENEKGMTTLDLFRYIVNLKTMHFSDSLLNIEMNSYQKCIENLGKVKFIDFKNRFDDLDDFEEIGCDFSNYYRWTGGQEPIDGIRIKEVKMKNANKATVTIEYFYVETSGTNYYWSNNQVILRKCNNYWEILGLNWR
jgi:hypothetical protein